MGLTPGVCDGLTGGLQQMGLARAFGAEEQQIGFARPPCHRRDGIQGLGVRPRPIGLQGRLGSQFERQMELRGRAVQVSGLVCASQPASREAVVARRRPRA